MNSEIQELKIIGLDKKRIDIDSCTGDYLYPLKLSSCPEPKWGELFNDHWEKRFDLQKRKAYVSGDCIVIILKERDPKKQWIETIKLAVAETNSEYNRIRQKEAKEQEHQEKLRKEKLETLRKLREEADELQF